MVRQLTAIMFTDMVGYTALMQENEHQAMLNRDLELHESSGEAHMAMGGETLLWAGEPDEAEAVPAAVLSENPMFRAATETLGWVKFAKGETEEALKLFETIPESAGHKFAAAAVRGYAYARLGRTEEAHRMLALLTEREQGDPNLTLARINHPMMAPE